MRHGVKWKKKEESRGRTGPGPGLAIRIWVVRERDGGSLEGQRQRGCGKGLEGRRLGGGVSRVVCDWRGLGTRRLTSTRCHSGPHDRP